MITIASIEKDSDAEKAGFLAGDRILRVNGEEVRDNLDFEFLRSEGYLDVELMRGSETLAIALERETDRPLGIDPEVMKIKICRNDCVFCFVYQGPKGMRKSLYIKDEDYRYSFLDGHFTTFSNMKPEDWQRVQDQRLSPLYVSVHATNQETRVRMLRNPKLEPILDRLHWLRENDLRFHTQLVVVPGWNDGEELERSLRELRPFHPWLLSISVVPVGLTRHRNKLVPLRELNPAEFRTALDVTLRHDAEAFAETGEHFIFPSDEFYVRTGEPLPPASYYGDFSQHDNGVGTLRLQLEKFHAELPKLPRVSGQDVTVLTGTLASGVQREILEILRQERGLGYELLVCENKTFGDSVTVTGLLCGKDFEAALENSRGKGPILLPPNSLNTEGRFLDDMTPAELSARFGRSVSAPRTFQEYFLS